MKKIEVYKIKPKGTSAKVVNIADYIKKQKEIKIKENLTDQYSVNSEQANPVDEI